MAVLAAVLSVAVLHSACAGERDGDAADAGDTAPSADVAADAAVPPDVAASVDASPPRDTAGPVDVPETSDATETPDAPTPPDAPADICVADCAGLQCGSDGCGDECGTCPDGTSCTPVGTCEPDVVGPIVQRCDAQNAFLGVPLGIHCMGEDAAGAWIEVFELVSADLDGVFVEGNAILTDRPLDTPDLGPHHFEIVGRDADGAATPVFAVDVLVERFEVMANIRHGAAASQSNFPNALYELLGAECAFVQYTPLADLGLGQGDRAEVAVDATNEAVAVDCMTALLRSLPMHRPDVWAYARHYGADSVTSWLDGVTGYLFWIRDYHGGR